MKGANKKGIIKNVAKSAQGEGEIKNLKGVNMKGLFNDMVKNPTHLLSLE